MRGFTFNPNSKLLLRASERWAGGFPDEAIQIYRKACKKEPKNLAVKLATAKALGLGYYHADAEKLLASLNRLGRSEPMLHVHVGQIARDIRRPELSLQAFSMASDRLPKNGEIDVEAAQILEKQGNFRAALERVRTGIEKQRSQVWFRLVEARILSGMGRRQDALNIYKEVMTKAALPAGLRARAHIECGGVLDKLGEIEEAIDQIESGKMLIVPGALAIKSDGSVALEKARMLGRELTTAKMQAHRERSLRRFGEEDVCFLLGFPRSGTTLVEKSLLEVARCDDAEEFDLYGRFVHPVLVGTLGSYLASGDKVDAVTEHLRVRYLKGLDSGLGGREQSAVIDKNPSNTGLALSCARLFPEARFITVVRDPRDVLVSAFSSPLALNPETALFSCRTKLATHICNTMEAWVEARERLDEDFWREVRYEKFVRDTRAQTESLAQWLGISSRDSRDSNFLDGGGLQGYVHSPSHAQVREAPHEERVGRWEKYQAWFTPDIRAVLEPTMKKLGYQW